MFNLLEKYKIKIKTCDNFVEKIISLSYNNQKKEEIMEETVNDLLEKFKKIKKKGWIKSVESGTSGIGRTLENELEIDENQLELPDYFDIELKVKKANGFYNYVGLFCLSPISRGIKPTIHRLQEKYGYPDKDMPDCKVLQNCCFYKSRTRMNRNYFFSLNVFDNDDYIYLDVYDTNMELVERYAAWRIKDIENKLELKLRKLALIEAEKMKINGHDYFRYTTIQIYRCKGIKAFIKLVKEQKIKINFTIGVFKKGSRKGQLYDHGTSFQIKKEALEELFEKIA